jgi:hypothetical protein
MVLAWGEPGWNQEAPGYRLRGRSAVVEGRESWQAWEAPLGVRVIEEDGTVRPRFLRAQVNAVAEAGQFMRVEAEGDTLYGGLRQAGSNPEDAARIIDGDPLTFWEPDPADGVDRWFAVIDLGRAVIARRLRVRFAPAGLGDPFLKFRVMVSDGRRAFGQSRQLQFFRVGQVNWRNKEEREFTFEIEPLRPVPPGVQGEVVQFVRFDALASDGPRGEEVGREEYGRLEPEDQGAIDYFRVTVAGREIPVLPETHALLPSEEKGPVRYYRRERPRLAEIEVEAQGDNAVALTQSELFADQAFFANLLLRQVSDGLHSSSFDMRVYDPLRNTNQLAVDLGAKYWLDRVRLISPENPPVAYQMRLSDGSLDPAGELIWKTFDERLNPDSFLQLEESFALQEVRHIEVRRLELVGSTAEKATLSEVQAYGQGYVSEVSMTSPLVKMGRPRLFSTLEWEGEAPPGTRLEVRTRSGDDLLEIRHYYDRFGREISEERWVNIRNVEHRGPVVVEEKPGAGWSAWSQAYEQSGEPFRSPGPRRMAQVQVRLSSRDPLRAARIRRLQLNFTEPLVEQLVAEVWPVRRVEPGVEREFTLYVRPTFAPGDPGFDRIRLSASSSVALELNAVRQGSDAALRLGGAGQLWPGRLEIGQGPAGEVELVFPEVVSGGTPVYAMVFRTRLFLNSTAFKVELFNGQFPGVAQMASEGDASGLADSQGLVVVADLRRAPLLGEVAVAPGTFTPNEDGINEAAEVRFSVFRLEGNGLFAVEVLDLGGRRVRDLSFARDHASGEHRVRWDGRDQAGKRVPPGTYLVRLHFEADSGGAATQAVRPVRVVY